MLYPGLTMCLVGELRLDDEAVKMTKNGREWIG
jgi:hypothetical protein